MCSNMISQNYTASSFETHQRLVGFASRSIILVSKINHRCVFIRNNTWLACIKWYRLSNSRNINNRRGAWFLRSCTCCGNWIGFIWYRNWGSACLVLRIGGIRTPSNSSLLWLAGLTGIWVTSFLAWVLCLTVLSAAYDLNGSSSSSYSL